MMLKTSGVAAQDFGVPQTMLVPLLHNGRMGPNDSKLLEKRAGVDFLHILKAAQLAPDEVPIHTIALGATEFYGCFGAGTPIAMADGRYVDVEQVAEGALTLSAEGNEREVTATFARTAPTGVRLDVSGLVHPLACSDDHPFRVARREQFSRDHDQYKRCMPPTQGKQNICNRTKTARDCVIAPYREIAVEWSVAGALREGDFLVWTCPQVEPPRPIGVDEGYVIGSWLAEGCFQRNSSNGAVSSLRLSININEEDFTRSITAASVRCGMLAIHFDGEADRGELVITVTGNPARCREYFGWFGEHALHKRLPPWVCCLPRETRLAIVAGYIDGDSSCQVSDKENRTTARSHGRSLALGIQRLLWSLGSPGTVCPVDPKDTGNNWGYSVSFPNSGLPELMAYSWKFRPRELKQTTKVHGLFHRGRMYLPVRGMERIDAPFVVYNFEVDEDHTYSGPNVDSHNCNRNGDGFRDVVLQKRAHTFEKFARFYRNHVNKNPEKSYGRIIKAAYIPAMHRIDLLCGLNGSEKTARANGGLVADKELEKLHAGKDLPTSMACKVAYDVCSGCNNHARTRDEYCDGFGQCKYGGLKKNITVTFDDGHQLHADNPEDLTWFDESHVYKGADRIAASLGILGLDGHEKAAAFGRIGGAELAERIGLTAPIEILIDPALPRRVQAQIKLAHALADIEEQPDQDSWSRAFARDVRPHVREIPDVQAYPQQLRRVMRALHSEKVALPIRDFLALMLDKAAADEIAEDVAAQLPGVFGRLIKDARFDEMLRHNAYNPSEELPDTRTRHWAASLVPDHGLGRKEAEARVTRSVLRGAVPALQTQTEETVKEASDGSGAEKLAREYALYKLAFLSTVEERGDSEFPLTSTLLVRQNYVF